MDGLTFTASVLWLLPPVLAVLLWFRFLSGRRTEVLAGSLLIWKRLAAQQPVTPPRRFVFDRSLLLQALALTALVAALARPEFNASGAGRTFVLVVDNGPLARFKDADGAPLWNAVKARAVDALDKMDASDRVLLVRSAPFPKLLSPEAQSLAGARNAMDTVAPALSGPDAESVLAFARDTQRSSGADGTIVASAAAMPRAAQGGCRWLGVSKQARENVGIVAFGAAAFSVGSREQLQGMVRAYNARNEAATVAIRAKQGGVQILAETRSIPPGEDAVVWVDGVDPAKALRFELDSDDGLDEDNLLVAQPAMAERVRVRFHAPMPALRRLFASALKAELLPPESKEIADLDVYAGQPPQQLAANARALLLVEPTAGYRFFFDVGDARLEAPQILRDELSVLTENFKTGGEAGLFPVSSACELLRTGAFTSLLKDGRSQRTLAARFTDEQGRPGYVLAFTPGAGAPLEALLPAELATLLIRMVRDAAGRTQPFVLERAAVWEARHDAPAPPGSAVLDVAVTSLKSPEESTRTALDFPPAAGRQRVSLRPWLALLGMLLLAAEFLLARPAFRALPV